MSATAISASPAIIAFERRRAELLAQRRRATLLYGGLLLLALLVSAWFSEVSPARLVDGIPRFGDYLVQTVPHLEWRHLLAGTQQEGSLAYWFYRLDSWALLLLETANIAAFATLFGALCFGVWPTPASWAGMGLIVAGLCCAAR